LLQEDVDGKKYIDAMNIRYLRDYTGVNKNVVDSWVKIEPTPATKDARIKLAKKLGIYTKDWDSLTHCLLKFRVRMDIREKAIIYSADYNSNGVQLHGTTLTPEFSPIAPETFAETLFEYTEVAIKHDIVK
jgi:hypothetical protein